MTPRVLAAVLVAAGSIVSMSLGRWYGHRDESALRIELQATVTAQRDTLDALVAEMILLRTELRREQLGADRMYSWYERCLDGRACTDTLPPLELHRAFERPTLPHMRLPGTPSRTE